MDDNKLAYLSLNIDKPDCSLKLTNKQNSALMKLLKISGSSYIDLYDYDYLSRLDLSGIRNADSVIAKIKNLITDRGDIAWKIEKWQQNGIKIITPLDELYPKRLTEILDEDAPAVIYSLGNTDIFKEDGIAVVGSREIDKEVKLETIKISELIVSHGFSVISGGAAGVDFTAMKSALDIGGKAIGFLKKNFSFKNLSQSGWNKFIEDGSLLLLTEINPDEILNRQKLISAAMNRNKFIYALALYGIVVSSDISGGTWKGAYEQINKYKRNVFVLNKDIVKKKGNQKLLSDMNALILPEPDNSFFSNLTEKYRRWQNLSTNQDKKSEQLELNFYD